MLNKEQILTSLAILEGELRERGAAGSLVIVDKSAAVLNDITEECYPVYAIAPLAQLDSPAFCQAIAVTADKTGNPLNWLNLSLSLLNYNIEQLPRMLISKGVLDVEYITKECLAIMKLISCTESPGNYEESTRIVLSHVPEITLERILKDAHKYRYGVFLDEELLVNVFMELKWS